MMQNELEDCPDTDSSDEEYVPGGAESDCSDSHSDSGGGETRGGKRKGKKTEEEQPQETTPESKEKVKEKSDKLWAEFLKEPDSQSTTEKKEVAEKQKVNVTKTYEFAGETVSLSKEVPADSKEAKEAASSAAPVPTQSKPALPKPVVGKRPAALSGILGAISGKKTKMSTLAKSKHDWDSFKESEGISDELRMFSQGKQSYVERQAFLQRTDVRQFEVERDLRLSRRIK